MGRKKNSADARRPRRRRFHGITEYSTMYKSYPIAGKNESFRPTGNLTTEGGKMDGHTTHSDDYKTHPIEKVSPIRRSDQIEASQGDMDLRTSYENEFTAKELKPARYVKNNELKHVVTPPKFSGDPTYRVDYQQWDIGKRELAKAPDEYKPSSDPLENQTTFRRDYQAKTTTPVQSMKPERKLDQSDEPIDTNTSHKLDYVAHPMPPKYVRDKPKYTKNTVQLEAMTTSRRDYTVKKAVKMESCRPSQEPMKSEEPFMDATTSKVDYQKWDVTLPKLHQADVYIEPTGVMDTLTTSKRDFPLRKIDRVIARKPSPTSKVGVGSFDDRTNYKQDYLKWEGHHPERSVDPSRKSYQKPVEAFGGVTNYQTSYQKKQPSPRENFAPKPNLTEAGEFHAETSYSDNYIMKKLASKDRSKKKVRPDHHILRSSVNLPKIESMTTAKRDYTAKEITKQPSFKPSRDPLHTAEPFEGHTTSNTDYKQYTVKLPKLHEAEKYSRPTGTMELETTAKRDFPPRKLEKIVMAKPPTRSQADVGPFDSTTNYSKDFQKYEGHHPVKGVNPTRKPYQEPEEPFGEPSSYQREYDHKPISVRKAIVPKTNELTNSNELFDSNTLYKDEFMLRKSEKRSAMKPVQYGRFVMEYDNESEVESSIGADPPSAAVVMTTEKAVPTPPMSTQIAQVA